MAAAKASTSKAGTRAPTSPSTRARRHGMSKATTGVPTASASAATMPKVS